MIHSKKEIQIRGGGLYTPIPPPPYLRHTRFFIVAQISF